ncbi:hypothetical protein [Lysobacter antibioticus]|uniref:Uncharacterized protein n=1 Tax=Lysobacter antibioticus TaxID=84531 RepID=A0A0S2FE28_LYSAN|nr:hypothetical protein [Lysobacter antibioticus]ALN81782.1 hypothetical protein LA76x_3660 [Lysobacter antibioticus]
MATPLIRGLMLALLLAPFTVLAQSAYIDIEQRLSAEQLSEVGLSPAQLQLLNRMLREASAKDPAPAVAGTSAAPVTSAAPEAGQRSAAQYIGLDDQPIKSRLKGDVAGWEPGTVFELDNGQQWKVLKGSMKLRKPLIAPEILVVPGVAGRWFLQVDEDMPKARVYRID